MEQDDWLTSSLITLFTCTFFGPWSTGLVRLGLTYHLSKTMSTYSPSLFSHLGYQSKLTALPVLNFLRTTDEICQYLSTWFALPFPFSVWWQHSQSTHRPSRINYRSLFFLFGPLHSVFSPKKKTNILLVVRLMTVPSISCISHIYVSLALDLHVSYGHESRRRNLAVFFSNPYSNYKKTGDVYIHIWINSDVL